MGIIVWRGLMITSIAIFTLFLASAAAQSAAAVAPAPQPQDVIAVAGSPGISTPISYWMIQSSALAQEGGEKISRPSYSTLHWLPVSAHATVMAGLIENRKYPDIFHGLNLQTVQETLFEIPWWYRTTFRLSKTGGALHTFIIINGIIPKADVWLNGKEVANHHDVAGVYTTHEIDVTQSVHAGTNVLAIHVYQASPMRDLAQYFIDWNPAPPDNNMGIWRNVEIARSGPVSLHDLHVLTSLKLPGLGSASLTVKARVRNDTQVPQDAVVSGQVAGIILHRRVHLAPKQTRTLVFDPRTNHVLTLEHPKVWWPAGLGSHPLYDASLTVQVKGATSDDARTTFGIRNVTSHLTKQGYRQFVVNGVPLLIRGAAWAPDMFLRDRPDRMETEFRYIHNLGLNAIRSEGKLERPEFYQLADREGIMILAGWDCCDKWEAWAGHGGDPWTAADLKIAEQSMMSEAKRLRDHPSVIAFLIGSDWPPPSKIAKVYVNAMQAADWAIPIVSAASARFNENQIPSRSGMKMTGPYAWIPPIYWYSDKVGGAFGFNSETSAGVTIPRMTSLRQMLTPQALEALWKYPDVLQYHMAPFSSPMSSLKIFDTALAQRYGKPKSLTDYVKKAHLASYEAVRAEFEAYSARMDAENPSTGVVYWMLNNAWPELRWHLIDYSLDPDSAYFGAQKANEPVHIQYSYDDRSVMGINQTLKPTSDLDAQIHIYNLDGRVLYSRKLSGLDLSPNHATRLATIPELNGLSSTYFVELELTASGGQEMSRNVYWLSTRPDIVDWTKQFPYVTLTGQYADLTELQKLPTVQVDASAHTRQEGSDSVTTVTVTAPRDSRNVAFFLHVSLRQAGGKPVVPITWSGNDISLWPGESITLTTHYQADDQTTPVVRISGWNVPARSISISGSERHGDATAQRGVTEAGASALLKPNLAVSRFSEIHAGN